MERKEKKGKRWQMILAVFLAAMFFFTVLSKIADSFTTARVVVTRPKSMKISTEIKASGQVEKNQELAVLTQPDIRVAGVMVQSGDAVQEGDVLAQLDMEDLQSRIDDINMQIENYELTNAGLYSSAQVQETQRTQSIQRAREDYDRIQQEGAQAVQQAKDSLDEAQAALAAAEDEAERARLSEQVNELQSAYDSAAAQQSANDLAAQRALEDAQAEPAKDYSAQINQMSIEKLQTQLEELTALAGEEGRVTAPAAGTITNRYLEVGQKTTDTAAFTMTDESEGLRFVAEVDGGDAKYLSAGNTVSMKDASGNTAECVISSVTGSGNGDKRSVTVMLPPDVFCMGETLTMTYTMESGKYDTVVPLSALYSEEQQYFVYVAELQNTLLGDAYVIRRMDVDVLEKNGDYAAVNPSALDSDSQVVTQTDRYVEAGERVRLTEQ